MNEHEHDPANAPFSLQRPLRPPPPPPAVPPAAQRFPPTTLARHHTIAGPRPPNLRPPPPPPRFPRHSSPQRSQNPSPMTSVARSPSLYVPPGAILAVPADNPNAAPVPMIPYNPQSSHFVYYHQPQRTQSMNRYASPPPPPPPPPPPRPPFLPHFQNLSSQPARYSSPPSTPISSRPPLVPPRPPKPPALMAKSSSSANSQSTSSPAMSSSDIPSSAPSHGAYTSSVEEGVTSQPKLQLDTAGRSDMTEESASYDRHDVTNQFTSGGSGAQTRSPEHDFARPAAQDSTTWEPPPPAYEESMSHEEFMDTEPPSSAAATGIEATFGRPNSLRANVQAVFPTPSPPGSSILPPPTVPEPPVPSASTEAVDQITPNQYHHASGSHDVGDVSQLTSMPVKARNRDSSQASLTLEAPLTQTSPIPPPPIVTRFRLPPPSASSSPPSPVSSRPPSPVIFSPAALGYDPTTDTRIDPFVDVPSTPPQTTLPIVRDALMSKRVSMDQTSFAEGPVTPVSRRRRMFSSSSVPGRERLSSLLLPMSSTLTHPDRRSQSVGVGPSNHLDLLGPGGVILEQEWTEQGGLPYSNVPDGRKKRSPPSPPTELEIREETSMAMGGGEIVDLWHGVEFGYHSPSWDIAPDLLRTKCPLSDFPTHDSPLTLYPGPSTPFFIRAPSWRALLRLLATLNETRIEPTPEALADMKRGAADLRLVVQFVKTPFLPPVGSGEAKIEHREVALYLCIHREVPSIKSRIGKSLRMDDRAKWSSWDTSILPYGFKAAAGSRLATDNKPSVDVWLHSSRKAVADAGTPISEQEPDGDGSLFITLPPPFVELPATLSDLALYLQDSLVRSRRSGKRRAMTDPKGHSEDPGKTRHVLEKANKSTTNLAVPAPSRPLSMYSATSTSRPSTSHSRVDSASGTHLSPQCTPSVEADVERGKGFAAWDQPFSPPVITPQERSAPSPVPPNPSPSPPPQINLAQIPGIKRLARAIKAFYPDESTLGSSHLSTGEGSSKPHSKGIFGKMKSKTSQASGAFIGRVKKRESNLERCDLVTPWRAPGL